MPAAPHLCPLFDSLTAAPNLSLNSIYDSTWEMVANVAPISSRSTQAPSRGPRLGPAIPTEPSVRDECNIGRADAYNSHHKFLLHLEIC